MPGEGLWEGEEGGIIIRTTPTYRVTRENTKGGKGVVRVEEMDRFWTKRLFTVLLPPPLLYALFFNHTVAATADTSICGEMVDFCSHSYG